MEAEGVASKAEAKAEADEFEKNVTATQEGLDAADAGRVRPFEEFLAEHRRRFPDALKPCAEAHGY